MTLTELRHVVAAAQLRHFGRAARACFVSQPTLSVSIKKLEVELGVQIFERRGNTVTVTPIGERVVAQAQQALEAADGVKQVAQEGKDQLVGAVRIGAIYTVGPYLFPDLIPLLSEQAPNMPLIVEEDYTAVLADKLKRGDLDVVLLSLPFQEKGVVTMPLYEEPLVVLMPVGHPLSQLKAIGAKQLEGERVLLLGPGHCFRDQVLEACPGCAPHPGKDGGPLSTIEGGSLETIRHMVVSGLGVTVVPCTAAGADRYSQRLLTIRRFNQPVPSRQVALAWRVSFPRPKVVDLVRQCVEACQLSCVRTLTN